MSNTNNTIIDKNVDNDISDENIIKLRNSIEKLNPSYHKFIFNIFKKHNIEYSENKNGIFINLSEVDNNVINEVNTYLLYLNKQEQQINKIENQKIEYQNKYFL
jgi:tRNA U34 5-carboxymethylaminomethyl modifying enzyme MnmG/GidA